jgi:dethiobiotin synthetase
MNALFVTASGTGIGKTFVTAGLLRHYINQKKAVRAIKPVLSGFDPDNLAESDSGLLLTAQDQDVTLENVGNITPWRFAAPLAPDMAARRESRTLDFDAVVTFSHDAISGDGTLFIEGVGGVMTPLTSARAVLDWMEALGLPLILVVGSYLGAISHALTAFDSARRRDLHVVAIVVSESEGSAVPLDETVDSISRFAESSPCLTLPRAAATHSPAFSKLARILDTNNA